MQMVSPSQARQRLLTTLLEAYERSASFGIVGAWRRDVLVRFDARTFPEAFSPEGREWREALVGAARLLEMEGVARVVRHSGPASEEPRELRLGVDELGAAYAAAKEFGFRPLAGVLAELQAAIRSVVATPGLPEWSGCFLARVQDALARADTRVLGFSRERLKRESRDVADAIVACARLSAGLPGWQRVVSEQIFANSKRLGEIRPLVVDLLVRADPRWDGLDVDGGDPPDVLEVYGVRRRPGVIRCAGTAAIAVRGTVYRLEDFTPTASIPEDWSTALVHGVLAATTHVVTTIENEYPFFSYVEDAGGPGELGRRNELVVYTGGFPSVATLQALAGLAGGGVATFRHWGDADVGGLLIWWFLRSRLRRSIEWFRTTAEWVAAEGARGATSLDTADRMRLLRLRGRLENDVAAPDVRIALDALDAMLKAGVKIEQERW